MNRATRFNVCLLVLVTARLVVHVLYLPVFEGPDEPFHLARAVAFLEETPGVALEGVWVGEEIAGAIRAYPCGPDLARAFDCPPFTGSSGAEFNILRPPRAGPVAEPPFNYESHHPPLYYLGGAVVLFASRAIAETPGALSKPATELLIMRLFSVFLVLAALALPLCAMARTRSSSWLWGISLLLLVPGASESLARCANDVGVFAWAAVVVWAIDRELKTRTIALLLVLGPLIKLTAIPVVVFAVVWLFLFRPRLHAAFAALASLSFLPLQWLRGHMWGGTVEANAPALSLNEPLGETVLGLLRSTYTLIKTSFWLGEWSFFRAPVWLLVLLALFLLLLALSLRLRPVTREQLPHLAGLAAGAGAVLFFFISHRMYWNQWGGVGGWYVWAWVPWLAVAFASLFRVAAERTQILLWASLVLVLIANAAWFSAAHSIYS